MEQNFLPLTEYSSKYKLSISTLRRKIKSNDIRFRFEHGKYLILDESFEREGKRPSQAKVHVKQRPSPQSPSLNGATESDLFPKSSDAEKDFLSSTSSENKSEEPILTAANRLLTELKKAYTQILQEKEEQILHLREEVADLKTLVRVLESENQRKQDHFDAGFREFSSSSQNFSEKD